MARLKKDVLKTKLRTSILRMNRKKTQKTNQNISLKREVAELLRQGKEELARIKVESIYREDLVVQVYELIGGLVELLSARLEIILMAQEPPANVMTALDTVLFAAPLLDIGEFMEISQMLSKKFGKEFVEAAQLNSRGMVHPKVIPKLTVHYPDEQTVVYYLTEIAKEHNVDWAAPQPQMPFIPHTQVVMEPGMHQNGVYMPAMQTNGQVSNTAPMPIIPDNVPSAEPPLSPGTGTIDQLLEERFRSLRNKG
ncbi:hypothetical protein PCE1_001772 [Barthelona sp. PCE]